MVRLYRLPGFLVFLFFVCPPFAEMSAAQTPPRDNAAAPTPVIPTAVVRGRITAAATGLPLHRARITMNGAVANPPTAVTDANGVFEITRVPAGTYSITTTRSGYLPVQYGQRRPRESGRALQVWNGEMIERIDIPLFAGAVLAGRIVDQLGDPTPGVSVEAMDLQLKRGQRLPLQAGSATTNDLGEFRISGLNPGTYYLRASTTETWADEDVKKGTYAYAQTFYPGVAEIDRAQTIDVVTGQEVERLDYPLVVGRAVRVTGMLLNATGEPIASQAVNLDRITRTVGGALYSAIFGGATRSDQKGAFELRDMPPGEYNLMSGGSQTEYASITPFFITDSDVENVVLTTRKPSSVKGSVTSDDGTALPFPSAGVRILPLPTDVASVLQAWLSPSPQAVGADWSWRFGNIHGPHLFRPAGLPDDWMLSAVRLNGREITDVPLDIPKGGVETDGLQIILTKKAAKVSGDVVTAGGSPAADSTVIVFAADDRRWGFGTRSVKSVRPDSAGRFSVGGLPAGPYLAIAKDFVTEGQWEDPDYLRNLIPNATRIELIESGDEKVRLTVTQEPQR